MTTKTIYRNFGTFSDRLIDANLEAQFREKQLRANVTQAIGFMMFAFVPIGLVCISICARFILTDDHPDDLLNKLTLNGSILAVIFTFLLTINLLRTVKAVQRLDGVYVPAADGGAPVFVAAPLSSRRGCSKTRGDGLPAHRTIVAAPWPAG